MLGSSDPGTRLVAVKIENLKKYETRDDRLGSLENTYKNIVISGSARVHFGNTFGNTYY